MCCTAPCAAAVPAASHPGPDNRVRPPARPPCRLRPRRPAVPPEHNSQLITVTWPVRVPPLCLELALGSRVCAVRVDKAEVARTQVAACPSSCLLGFDALRCTCDWGPARASCAGAREPRVGKPPDAQRPPRSLAAAPPHPPSRPPAPAARRQVVPLLYRLLPSFKHDLVLFNSGLHYPMPGADGKAPEQSELVRSAGRRRLASPSRCSQRQRELGPPAALHSLAAPGGRAAPRSSRLTGPLACLPLPAPRPFRRCARWRRWPPSGGPTPRRCRRSSGWILQCRCGRGRQRQGQAEGLGGLRRSCGSRPAVPHEAA